MKLNVTSAVEAGIATVTVVGEVDVSNADALRAAVDAALRDEDVQGVAVNMEHVPYIDSTGIGVLVGAAHRAADEDRSFVLLKTQGNVARILGMLGVDEVIALIPA
jgi:anti-sigma B factor antagonist